VSRTLEFASRAIQDLTDEGWTTDDAQVSGCGDAASLEKILSETAMLLFAAASVQDAHASLREPVARLAATLAPRARGERILAGFCIDPHLAYERAAPHAVVSRLGHPDPRVDRLLVECFVLDDSSGPERTPLAQLEREWLGRVWQGLAAPPAESGLLRRSMLGRRLDVLGAARMDVYSFTHAIIYASDFGGRRFRAPRSLADIGADADAALALSFDIDDLDVTAELLMTWPMLAIDWSPAAAFGFALVAAIDDRFAFLPGPTFVEHEYHQLAGPARDAYVRNTSYHTTYVMGMLCAACLRHGRRPPRHVVSHTSVLHDAIRALLADQGRRARWRERFDCLSPHEQGTLAPLILTLALRRMKDGGDLAGIRRVLDVALAHGVARGPAIEQAAALVRRTVLMSEAINNR